MNVTPTGHVPFGTDAGHRRVVTHPAQPIAGPQPAQPQPIAGAARRVLSPSTPQLGPNPFPDRVVLLDQRRVTMMPPVPQPPSPQVRPLDRRVVLVEPPPPLQIPPAAQNRVKRAGCPHVPFGSGRGGCHL